MDVIRLYCSFLCRALFRVHINWPCFINVRHLNFTFSCIWHSTHLTVNSLHSIFNFEFSIYKREWPMQIFLNKRKQDLSKPHLSLLQIRLISLRDESMVSKQSLVTQDFNNYSRRAGIGGFHAVSGDINNKGEMNKCWWTNKAS